MALATNPLETFVWGAGGTRKTPEEIARDREIADAMTAIDTSPVAHWSQGLARVANAMAGSVRRGRADKAEARNAKESQSRIAALLGGLGGGSNPTSQFPPAPVSGQPAAAPMDYASSRVSQAFGDAPGGDIRTGIIATAQSLGIDPLDLATTISYETAGTFDPTKKGPRTQHGQHQGLIQFGEPQAQRYGVDWNDPLGSQLGPDGAVAKYLKDTGVQPGMGLLDIYSAINAGGVGRYDRSDANNGGAPGTVADKVNNQMAEHRQKAMALLGAQQPQQAPPMGQPAPSGSPMPEMAGNVQRPVQMAQNGGMNPAIIEALSSPYASAQERNIAGILLEQEMQKNDPMRALEMEKARLEMEAMRNPKPKYDFLTGRDGSIFRTDSTGKMEQVYGGKPEQPTDVREYEYAKQQGYPGTFTDWQIEQKRAGASQVNIDQKTEGAFDKKLAEKQAETFDVMATEGMAANADIAVIGELETLLGQNGGVTDGIAGWLAQRGIGGEGMSDLQAAQALINKLVPTQRQPGSGSMSDRDVELFTRSLPNLWNTPGGNQKILSVMRGLAQYKQQQGQIAQAVMAGEMTRQEATAKLRSLPNPLAGIDKPNADTPPQGVDPADWEFMTPEERRLFQ